MKRAGRIVAWGLGGVAGLVLVMIAVAFLLPVEHSATVSRVVTGTPEEVWAVITDIESFSTWRTDIDRAERLEPRAGWPAWREEGPSGALTFEMGAVEPPKRLVTSIVDEGLPFGGTWTYVLDATDAGTLVTITEDGRIYSPVYRFVARFFLGYEVTMLTYLDGLEARMGR